MKLKIWKCPCAAMNCGFVSLLGRLLGSKTLGVASILVLSTVPSSSDPHLEGSMSLLSCQFLCGTWP